MQPNLQTPTVESYTLKIEQQLDAEHDAERRLHRLARLPRIALRRRQPAGSDDLPRVTLPTQATRRDELLPAHAPGQPAVWNTTHWFSEGVSSYNGLEVDVNHRLATACSSAASTHSRRRSTTATA